MLGGGISAQNNQLSRAGYENFVKAGVLIEQAGEISDIEAQKIKFLEAIAILEQITISDPNAADIYYNLSVLYKNIGITKPVDAKYIVKAVENLKKYLQLSPTTDKRGIEQKIALEIAIKEVWQTYETYYSSLIIPSTPDGTPDLKEAKKRNMYQDENYAAIFKKAERVKKRGWDIPTYFFATTSGAALGLGIGMYFTKEYDSGEYKYRKTAEKMLIGGACGIGLTLIFNSFGMHSYNKVLKREIPLYNKNLQNKLDYTRKIKPVFSMGVTGSGGVGLSLTF